MTKDGPMTKDGSMPAPLPPGGLLVHVGPAKTGTTSLQSSFHNNREALAAHDVHYAGSVRHSSAAIKDLMNVSPRVDKQPKGIWDRLAAEIRTSTAQRVVLSSEGLAHADAAIADRLLADVGRSPVRVVLTMRPLADMLASSWWQYVQTGKKMPYDEWLDGVLRTDLAGEVVTPNFWRRSRIEKVAGLWVERLGPEAVTLVSLAEQPRDFVQRSFEQLVGLPEGVLVPKEGQTNDSLSYQLAEMVRHFNLITGAEGAGTKQVVTQRQRAYNQLKARRDLLTEDRRVETPAWAVEKACGIMAEINDGIRALGINVIGDLDALTRPSKPAPETVEPAPTHVAVEDAAALLYFMMRSTDQHCRELLNAKFRQREQKLEQRIARLEERLAATPRIDDVGGRELLGLLAARARRRLGRS
jgi:hypothetical protein